MARGEVQWRGAPAAPQASASPAFHNLVPPKPALWALLLALLGIAPVPIRLRTCSVPDVLRHYQAVIFKDLQAAMRRVGPGSRQLYITQKNQTGTAAPRRQGRVGVSCSAQKEHSILVSIASLSQTLRGALAGGRRGALEKAVWTVALRTEAVMRRHCQTLRQRSPWPQTHPEGRRGGRRRFLLRALDAVATCWEKLFALRALAKEAPRTPCTGPGNKPLLWTTEGSLC
ncbi:uncharacterized protein C20orf204 homolog [Rhynchonycteris naso]